MSRYSDIVPIHNCVEVRYHNSLTCEDGCLRDYFSDIESFELPLQRKLLVLINPFSGAGKALQIFQNGVSHMLEEADIFFKMVVTG